MGIQKRIAKLCNQEVIQELLRETSDFKMKLEPRGGLCWFLLQKVTLKWA